MAVAVAAEREGVAPGPARGVAGRALAAAVRGVRAAPAARVGAAGRSRARADTGARTTHAHHVGVGEARETGCARRAHGARGLVEAAAAGTLPVRGGRHRVHVALDLTCAEGR